MGLVVLVVIAMSMFAGSARAQFSPGKLSRSHAAVSGATACFRCHEPRKATTAERCLDWHRTLGARIAAGAGFHGRMEPSQRARCGTCHAEHGGEAVALVAWPGGRRDGFDHRLAGFALEGAHAKLKCNDCHRASLIRGDEVRDDKSLRLEATHLGLSTRCFECHQDPHRGQFEDRVTKNDCKSCHGTSSWKPAAFDHASARFQLDGGHAKLTCARCHFPEDAAGKRVAAGTPGAVVRYRPVDFASCASCHNDPHAGRMGPNCASCHTSAGWSRLALGRFDHGRTRYPLTGLHVQVACSKCHWSETTAGKRVAAGSPGSRVHYQPVPFAQCTACHKDPHRDRLGTDCMRCHSTQGWSTVAANAFDHDRTRYPLRGRHRDVTCAKCHRPGTERTLAFAKCTDCHADAHRGQLARRKDRGACEACHDVDGFSPAHFGFEEHATTVFPLREAHRAVHCAACHRRAKPAEAGFEFALQGGTCTTCHADPHAGQFETKGATCTRCHAEATWRIAPFDHARTRFPLDGAHVRVACSNCHRAATIGGKPGVVRYRPLETACRSCHGQPPAKAKQP